MAVGGGWLKEFGGERKSEAASRVDLGLVRLFYLLFYYIYIGCLIVGADKGRLKFALVTITRTTQRLKPTVLCSSIT